MVPFLLVNAVCLYCRAVQAFQMVLYTDANFSRASDVHLRIGIIKKKNKDYEAATKVCCCFVWPVCDVVESYTVTLRNAVH